MWISNVQRQANFMPVKLAGFWELGYFIWRTPTVVQPRTKFIYDYVYLAI